LRCKGWEVEIRDGTYSAGRCEERSLIVKGASPFYISVDKRYLSEPFMISVLARATAKATILGVSKVSAQLTPDEKKVFEEHVVGREVSLFVAPGAFVSIYDALYFHEESWALLRDKRSSRSEPAPLQYFEATKP